MTSFHQPMIPQVSPYEVLGVKKEDNLEHINSVYKQLILLLHPDKTKSANSAKLGINSKDKLDAFIKVRDAYKVILKQRKESQYPDYNIDYFIDEEFKQNLDQYGYVEDDVTSDNFSQNKFNRKFDEEKKHHDKNGMADPFSRGYSEFGFKETDESRAMLTGGARSQISVSEPKEFIEPDMHDGRLVQYIPKESGFKPIGASSINYQELGLISVDDFSMSTGNCKGQLCGTDLMSVYGNNKENWETSVMRDESLHSRFNDQTDLNKKMNSMSSTRGNIYNEPKDRNLETQLREQDRMAQRMETIRRANMRNTELYYNDHTKSRIGY